MVDGSALLHHNTKSQIKEFISNLQNTVLVEYIIIKYRNYIVYWSSKFVNLFINVLDLMFKTGVKVMNKKNMHCQRLKQVLQNDPSSYVKSKVRVYLLLTTFFSCYGFRDTVVNQACRSVISSDSTCLIYDGIPETIT